ncbi:DMT family transporter [Alteromonas facilis]|uniref:DMT family transporter n=1 Tax=Alteromonas facilis TaxID=2048004 RepID=UPI000C2850C2|nr:DMT family transporter [Alteromonas facilis]
MKLSTQRTNTLLLGAICLIAAELCFAFVGALVKLLSEDMNQTQLVFFRNASAMVVLLPLLFKRGMNQAWQSVKTQRLSLHVFRACCGMLAMYGFFYVLTALTLAQAMMALLLAPFIVPIIARFWLHEHIDRKTLIAMCIGFVGVIFILMTKPDSNSQYPTLAILIALGCASLVATTKCAIRKLTDSEPSLRIVFYFTGIATLISCVPMLLFWQPLLISVIPGLVMMGILAAVGQLLMTKAFALASPVKIGLLSYTSLIFAAVIGAIGWNEPITLSLLTGSVLIIWAANITIRRRWLL